MINPGGRNTTLHPHSKAKKATDNKTKTTNGAAQVLLFLNKTPAVMMTTLKSPNTRGNLCEKKPPSF